MVNCTEDSVLRALAGLIVVLALYPIDAWAINPRIALQGKLVCNLDNTERVFKNFVTGEGLEVRLGVWNPDNLTQPTSPTTNGR